MEVKAIDYRTFQAISRYLPMRLHFKDLSANHFIKCTADEFHPESHLEIDSIEDLESRCRLRIGIFRYPQKTPHKSVIHIGKLDRFLSLSLLLSDSIIRIGNGSCGAWDIKSRHGSSFTLAGMNAVANGVRCVLEEDSEVVIGKDCMFSDEVLLQCGSQHAVISLDDMCQLNEGSSSIHIEDHVWLGRRSTVMSSSRSLAIGKGSILGINSTLTKSIPKTSLAVGSPARVVRERVTWSRKLRCDAREIEKISSAFPCD